MRLSRGWPLLRHTLRRSSQCQVCATDCSVPGRRKMSVRALTAGRVSGTGIAAILAPCHKIGVAGVCGLSWSVPGDILSRVAKISILVAALVLGSVAAVMAIWRPWAKLGDSQLINIDLARPDALISSAHLARLPADMLKLPILRDVLSEDFVFYYAHTDTGLAADGAIRRIAFEHDLTITDRLLVNLLDEPADMALWRAPDGKLRYWLLSIRRNTLAKLIDGLAKVAASDSQFQLAGEIPVAGKKTTLYALHLNAERTLLFAAAGERMVVLSDAAILFGTRSAAQQPKAAAAPGNEMAAYVPEPPRIDPPDVLGGLDRDRASLIADLLGAKAADNFLVRRFKLDDTAVPGHRISLAANFLSFGYQAFFPGVEALGFEFDGKAWRSQLLADGKALSASFAPIWAALPGQPAACFALPTDWKSLQQLADKAVATAKLDLAPLVAGLDGPAGVCWYARSRLATPLFLARFKNAETAKQLSPVLSKLFEAAIGAYEYNREGGAFPVETRKAQSATVLRRVVSSPFGTDKAATSKHPDQLSAARFFPVTLALTGNVVAFSPDAKLAEDALAVSAKRFPAAGDGLPDAARTVLRITPARLAQLLQAEALAVLPKDEEPIFSGVAQAQLLPRLEALGRYPGVTAALPSAPAAEMRWQPLVWRYDAK